MAGPLVSESKKLSRGWDSFRLLQVHVIRRDNPSACAYGLDGEVC
jgi:hypothetical protein